MVDYLHQLLTGKVAFQSGLRAKEQGVFEGSCVQSREGCGDAGTRGEVGQGSPSAQSQPHGAYSEVLSQEVEMPVAVGREKWYFFPWSGLNIFGEYSLEVKGQMPLSNPSSPNLIGPEDYSPPL